MGWVTEQDQGYKMKHAVSNHRIQHNTELEKGFLKILHTYTHIPAGLANNSKRNAPKRVLGIDRRRHAPLVPHGSLLVLALYRLQAPGDQVLSPLEGAYLGLGPGDVVAKLGKVLSGLVLYFMG